MCINTTIVRKSRLLTLRNRSVKTEKQEKLSEYCNSVDSTGFALLQTAAPCHRGVAADVRLSLFHDPGQYAIFIGQVSVVKHLAPNLANLCVTLAEGPARVTDYVLTAIPP